VPAGFPPVSGESCWIPVWGLIHNYLIIKFLSGWFAGETPADPPPLRGAFPRMKLVEVTRPCQMSYMQNPLFNVFTLAATSHYRNWGVNSNRAQHVGLTATTDFEAPIQIGSVQATFPTCIILSSAHLRRRGLPQSPEKWQRHLLLPLSTFTADSRSRKYFQGVHLMISLFTF